jgi:signal transduction histidine kinase
MHARDVLAAGRSAGRLLVGVLLGAVTAVVELVYLGWAALLLVPAVARPQPRRAAVDRIQTGARHLVEVERWRLDAFLGGSGTDDAYPNHGAVAYLAVRWAVGLLGGLVMLLFLYGLGVGAIWTRDLFLGRGTAALVVAQLIGGVVLLFLVGQGFAGLAALDRRVAHAFLRPSDRAVLEQRIEELAVSRAGVVAAVDAERRRIERDLHDGVQQRIVALGMLLGRARRSADPDKTQDLVRQAHDESLRVLDELREVAWRAYPSALDQLGLADALARVADRSGVRVRVDCRVDRLPPPVETAAYFVVSEAVTNAAKHAPASTVMVDIHRTGAAVVVTVTDDGPGGADPAGGGLSGLSRRVAALDGTLAVHSPPGGPTVVTAELPCG